MIAVCLILYLIANNFSSNFAILAPLIFMGFAWFREFSTFLPKVTNCSVSNFLLAAFPASLQGKFAKKKTVNSYFICRLIVNLCFTSRRTHLSFIKSGLFVNSIVTL